MKLIKIKINNRVERILNFDNREIFHNNTYIIRNHGNAAQELFRISSNPQLIDDEGAKYISVKIEENGNNLDVIFEDKKTQISKSSPKSSRGNQGTVENEPEKNQLEKTDDGFLACKKQKPANADCYILKFKYGDAEISINIYFASRENTYDAIIDFGSEATQATWFKEGRTNKINLTESILEMSKSAQSTVSETLTDYVQYEDDTLYKSKYYIKKECDQNNPIGNGWPTYDGECWKFLVQNSDSFTEYLELPNSKLIRFDLSEYAKLKIKLNNKVKPLWEINDHLIERTLLNNIVSQVLHAITSSTDDENNAYITLNILMPNIYPIDIAAEKLEWLAKDIDNWRKSHAENKGNKFAIELRAVSESDASMLGHINNLKGGQGINPGVYLIMDAGKGTLDFSFLEVKKEGTPYVNRSRAGIVGAGNAVTYGLLVGLVNDYLSAYLVGYGRKNIQEKQGLIQEFMFSKILNEDLAKKTALFKSVENYKKKYNELFSKQAAASEITQKDEANDNINSLALDEFIQWIDENNSKSLSLSSESQNYVTCEIEKIVNEAGQKLEGMVKCDNRLLPNGEEATGVIFTGRGFLMKELRDKMTNKLIELGIIRSKDRISLPSDHEMKSICMNINQMLLADQYDAAASQQTIGIHNHIVDGTKNQNASKKMENQEKAVYGGLGMGVAIRYAGEGDYHQSRGNVSNEGIKISGQDISNSSSISIGGWRYVIKADFEKHDSILYFDGINYLLTTSGKAPFKLGSDTCEPNVCKLGFESLFPNVVVSDEKGIVIPMPEDNHFEANSTPNGNNQTSGNSDESGEGAGTQKESKQNTNDSKTGRDLGKKRKLKNVLKKVKGLFDPDK